MTIEEYIEEHKDKDINIEVMAKSFNRAVSSMYRILREKGIKLKKYKKLDERLDNIKKLREEGKTYQEIGDEFGISRQRVEQIIHEHN